MHRKVPLSDLSYPGLTDALRSREKKKSSQGSPLSRNRL